MKPGRVNRIEEVLLGRTTRVTMLLENLTDPANASACIRTCEALGLNEMHLIESYEPFRSSMVRRRIRISGFELVFLGEGNLCGCNTDFVLCVLHSNPVGCHNECWYVYENMILLHDTLFFRLFVALSSRLLCRMRIETMRNALPTITVFRFVS